MGLILMESWNITFSTTGNRTLYFFVFNVEREKIKSAEGTISYSCYKVSN